LRESVLLYICIEMMEENSIKALIRLIDDPDESVFEHVRDKLLSYGANAIPYLENSWEDQDYGLIYQTRIEQIIHEIQFEEIKAQLKIWMNSPDKDLMRGAIIIAKYQYPGLNEEEINSDIQRIRRDIWLEFNNKQTAFEQVKIFNKVFFGAHNFHGDSKHFHSPMNSFINTVMESRKGNPLSLSLIYSVVAQSLDLPIYGVNLPNHFILAYLDENGASLFLPEKNEYGVLFYINPFSKGSILDANSIKEFLDGLKLSYKREYFEPCSNSAILRRMLTNLIASFQQVGNLEKVNELTDLRDLLD
jgi:regulator of sirC expression with transglutaminase-like and TPR domain